jgi:hypothetical protein
MCGDEGAPQMSSIHTHLATALALVLVACQGTSEDPSPGTTDAAILERPAVETLTTFDPAAGALPEGVAVRGETAYVGLAPTGEIRAVDLATGLARPFATLPHPVPNQGFMTGLLHGPDGTLYAALVSFSPDVQPGIYKVGAEGGPAKLHAKHASMAFPNGLVFGGDGALYVSDSARGAVFRIEKDGTTAEWLRSDLLAGNKDYCGVGVGAAFDIGANGIAIRGEEIIVSNNDKAQLVRIPILPEGRPGDAKVLVGSDCARLGGADGIAVEGSGDILVATNRLDRVVRVATDGSIRTVAEGGALDFPATIIPTSDREAIVTSFALGRATAGKDPHPALLRIRTR